MPDVYAPQPDDGQDLLELRDRVPREMFGVLGHETEPRLYGLCRRTRRL